MLPLFLIPSLLIAPTNLQAGDRINIAEDDASHSAYNSGWSGGKNAGLGFGEWILRSKNGASGNSHAGFYIADTSSQTDLDKAAIDNKAFGFFANGVDYETAVAFRSLREPLQPGDAFSLLMQFSDFVTKFESDDDRPGMVGFALRTANPSESTDEFISSARMWLAIEQGEMNYQIHDGESSTDTGVPIAPTGAAITVLLLTPDTYQLEITNLQTGDTTKLPARKLSGTTGSPIESFSLFAIDSERQDAYFNGFQVSRSDQSIGR